MKTAPSAAAPSHPLVGRGPDLERLERELERSRLVTVTGPPGVGKSRLVREARPDALFCDLGSMGPLEAAAVALDLDLDDAAHLGRIAAARRLTVVFDDADDRTTELAAIAPALLDVEGDSVFVVTSGRAVGVDAETVVPLGPLERDDAAALFFACAAGSDDPETVAKLCDRLDRLPLAIELAASRSRVMSPTDLLHRLDAGKESGIGAVLRTQSLSPPLARTLAATSTFAGGFTLASLDAVCGTDSADALERLIDRSLVRVDPNRRFALYTSLRGYARQAASDIEALDQAHADYFVAEAVRAPAPFAIVERANIKRAIKHHSDRQAVSRVALAVHRQWRRHENYSQTLARLDDALEGAEHTTRAKLLAHRVEALVALARWDEAETDATQALASAEDFSGQEAAGSPEGARLRPGSRTIKSIESSVLCSRATIAFERGDANRALDLALKGLARATDVPSRVSALLRVSYLCWQAGDLAAAEEHVANALAESGDTSAELEVRARYLATLTSSARLRIAPAIQSAQACLAVAEREGVLPLIAAGHTAVAWAALQSHDDERAERALAAATELYRSLGDLVGQARTTGMTVDFRIARGELDEARALSEREQSLVARAGFRRNRGSSLSMRGVLAMREGDTELAVRLLERGTRESGASGYRLAEHTGLCFLAIAKAITGDADGADDVRERAESMGAHLPSDVVLEFARPLIRLARGQAVGEIEWPSGDAAKLLEVRIARPLLEAAVTNPSGDRSLRVAADGSWFELGGERVELGRRRALRLLLAAFVDAHDRGETLSVDSLLEAGWPGEKVAAESGSRRVYTAMHTLRQLGLRSALVRRSEGYRLDPAVELEVMRGV